MIQEPLAIVAVLLGAVFFSLKMVDRYPWAERLSAIIWIIFTSALCSNLGLIPTDASVYDSLIDFAVPFAVCVEKPDTAKVPDNPIGGVILALGAVMRVDNSNINNWMKYLRRLRPETQFMFVQAVMRSSKAGMVARAAEFTKWARDNSWAV